MKLKVHILMAIALLVHAADLIVSSLNETDDGNNVSQTYRSSRSCWAGWRDCSSPIRAAGSRDRLQRLQDHACRRSAGAIFQTSGATTRTDHVAVDFVSDEIEVRREALECRLRRTRLDLISGKPR